MSQMRVRIDEASRSSPFIWIPYGCCGVRPVSPACSGQVSREKRLMSVSCEMPASSRVTVDVAPSILQTPRALRRVVSVREERGGGRGEERGEEERGSSIGEERKGGGGGEALPLL